LAKVGLVFPQMFTNLFLGSNLHPLHDVESNSSGVVSILAETSPALALPPVDMLLCKSCRLTSCSGSRAQQNGVLVFDMLQLDLLGSVSTCDRAIHHFIVASVTNIPLSYFFCPSWTFSSFRAKKPYFVRTFRFMGKGRSSANARSHSSVRPSR
jgi:hypothetical protein